ncbi:hypothetical protein DPMN_182849 [Dreissena polymorpha]|uniref:Uncharacterized protein n=1 Tax=Dreissena polymorpha TaxID=45954 RepID=A0A9D4I514_DREPO|nr:hypothetical protein DPMN_182849 [Dreissena polymorpha]
MDNKCSKETCGCCKQRLSCTSYCSCSGGQTCCNPHTSHQKQTGTNEEDEEEGGNTNLREEVAEEVDEGLNDNTIEEDGENEWD